MRGQLSCILAPASMSRRKARRVMMGQLAQRPDHRRRRVGGGVDRGLGCAVVGASLVASSSWAQGLMSARATRSGVTRRRRRCRQADSAALTRPGQRSLAMPDEPCMSRRARRPRSRRCRSGRPRCLPRRRRPAPAAVVAQGPVVVLQVDARLRARRRTIAILRSPSGPCKYGLS